MNDYKVYFHPQTEATYYSPTNPFRGQVFSLGDIETGLSDLRDHFDESQKNGVDLSQFIVGLSWNDSTEAPYSVANIELKIPDDLQGLYLPGNKPFKVKNFMSPSDLVFNNQQNPLANFFFKQTKTGAWISIHYPLPVDHTKPDSEEKFYTACFLGKLTNINYSIVADQNTGHSAYTNIVLQCESFVQPLIQSQFRVRLAGNDVEIIRSQARQQAKNGGPATPGPQTGQFGSDEYIGSIPPNSLMGVSDWINYVLNPLIQLSGTNKSLGYLFEKFSKLFSSQMVPRSVLIPKGGDSENRTARTRSLSDIYIVNYARRHNVGTKWEAYSTSLGQATNFKAFGSAVGKSCIWRWLLDTFVVDEAVIECFPLLVAPRGNSKRERDYEVSRLMRGLVANSAKSNYAKAVFPQDRLRIITQQVRPGIVPEEYSSFLESVNQVKSLSRQFSQTNLLPDLSTPIEDIDGALMRRGNPVEFNEYDNDILKAIIIRETYLALGVIPTIFYRLKPLAPGMYIDKQFMERVGVGLSADQAEVGSALRGFSTTTYEEESKFYQTASEQVITNEFEDGNVTTAYEARGMEGQASGPSRIASNYAFLDPGFWLGISFNYSESRRINAVYFDNVFTTGNDTLFDLDALKLVPDPVVDVNDIVKDGFRVYEGSFPFMQMPDPNIAQTQAASQDSKQMLLLPQAMAERAFVLLGKDNEYSSGVITMLYHENWDITPGIYGAIALGNTEIPDSIRGETQEEYVQRRQAAEAKEREIAEAKEREFQRRVEEARRNNQPPPERENVAHVVEAHRRGGLRLDDEAYFEFYIDSVERNITVDQETGMVSGIINITYSRGSVGRKQNYFRYHDFGLSSLAFSRQQGE